MSVCKYCKKFIAKDKEFCSDKCEIKYNDRVENDLSRYAPKFKSRGFTDNEKELQANYIKKLSKKKLKEKLPITGGEI